MSGDRATRNGRSYHALSAPPGTQQSSFSGGTMGMIASCWATASDLSMRPARRKNHRLQAAFQFVEHVFFGGFHPDGMPSLRPS